MSRRRSSTPMSLPSAVAILIGLFFFQSRGTTGVGKVFGPVTVLWFVAISALGCRQILRAPRSAGRDQSLHGFQFFVNNGWGGFVVLGAVFLAVTGGEALYADIGHFGTKPIRLTWFVIVLPALVLNYFGQGALLLTRTGSGRESVLSHGSLTGRFTRWSCSRRRLRSSRRRRSSAAPFPSPCRRSSSATVRV